MTTENPISRRRRHELHNHNVKGDALAKERGEDLWWACISCLAYPTDDTGIKLLDSHSDLNLDEGGPRVLTFRFDCPACGVPYDLKMSLGQGERYGTGGGLEG